MIILTLNSLISTIAVNQGGMSDSAVVLLILLSISPVNSFAICVIIVLIGLTTGPMIPFLNA